MAPKISIWGVGLLQLRAVSSNTPIQALKERLGGGSFLLGGAAKSAFASHTKQLHHHLGFFSFLAKTSPRAFYFPRGTGSSSVFRPAVIPENSGFHFRGSAAAAAVLGEDGSCSAPHWGPTAEPRTLPFPEAGSHNTPKIRMIQGLPRWQQQAFASGKQAAVGWQGLDFRVGRGGWWKLGRGPVGQIYSGKEGEQPMGYSGSCSSGVGWSTREEFPLFYCSCQAFVSLPAENHHRAEPPSPHRQGWQGPSPRHLPSV